MIAEANVNTAAAGAIDLLSEEAADESSQTPEVRPGWLSWFLRILRVQSDADAERLVAHDTLQSQSEQRGADPAAATGGTSGGRPVPFSGHLPSDDAIHLDINPLMVHKAKARQARLAKKKAKAKARADATTGGLRRLGLFGSMKSVEEAVSDEALVDDFLHGVGVAMTSAGTSLADVRSQGSLESSIEQWRVSQRYLRRERELQHSKFKSAMWIMAPQRGQSGAGPTASSSADRWTRFRLVWQGVQGMRQLGRRGSDQSINLNRRGSHERANLGHRGSSQLRELGRRDSNRPPGAYPPPPGSSLSSPGQPDGLRQSRSVAAIATERTEVERKENASTNDAASSAVVV